MGKYYCCMPNCHGTTGKIGKFGKVLTLHKLPGKDVSLRRAWIRAISRKHWIATDYTRVCSDHFHDGVGPNYFEKRKIPTENLQQKAGSSKPVTERSQRLSVRPLGLFNEPTGASSTEQYSHTGSGQAEGSSIQVQDKEVQFSNRFTHTSHEESVPIKFQEEEFSNGCSLTHTDHVETMKDQEMEFCNGYAKSLQMSHDEKDNDTCEKGEQFSPEMDDACEATCRPEITIEDIQHNDAKIQFYTGLISFTVFSALFSTLMEFGGDKLCTSTCSEGKNSSGRKRKLRPVDEFLMVMMRLRLGLLIKDLEYRFHVSSSTVSKIFKAWILFMHQYLQSLVFFPKLKLLQKNVPTCFKYFDNTRIILDCTEIFIQTPSSLENQSVTYSNYKSHNTFKFLIGINMSGAVVLISKLWGGSVSDVEITRESGLLDTLDAGDAVMVDKGFIHLKQDLEQKGVTLYCPPFKTKNQFSKSEVETTRRIASARIHVERKMEQIKNFRLIQGVMPLALNKIADEIVFVCSALTNLLPPLVS